MTQITERSSSRARFATALPSPSARSGLAALCPVEGAATIACGSGRRASRPGSRGALPLAAALFIAALAGPLGADDGAAGAKGASAQTEAQTEAKADGKTDAKADAKAEPGSPEAAPKAPEKSQEELDRERARREIDALKLELDRLSTEYQLMQQRQRNDLAKAELERQELTTKAALEQARLEQDLAAKRAEVARIQAEAQLEKAMRDRANSATEVALERRQLEAKLTASRLEAELEALRGAMQTVQLENAVRQEEVKRAQMEAQLARQAFEAQIGVLRAELELRGARDQNDARVLQAVERRENPLDGATLWVSDRRIALNGPIVSGTADFVCDRIDFFNNQSQSDPIFIVIDNSPGGSVMEGYRIVKAIETSPAPVHVVVKSFAASMAAIITSLAQHSYALPNALILHHQMSSGMRGNLTQQREQFEKSMEWARRLAEPLAAKMGINYDELVRRMYENNSDGDWVEFADRAQALKWVDHIVEEIREEGFRDRPTGNRASLPFWMEAMVHDEKGNPYVKLPPLMPFDHYFMYDPTNFWR
ncbi:MAG TPA: ATP-dependent Clp protease proteolytic subunit [Phycisphaerales bacterium]|nr:ATP-dependent Clp protease proteolytic subunit [Phycisphaerales bacterium]HMP38312.1 ATP-dependent Clp protease proteolytic subunit [Phycisphaerales bacterium]